MDEADDLIQAILMPEETHPLALVAWLLAQYRFFTNVGRDEDADRCLQQAYAIMPDHPRVKTFWEKRRH